MAVVCRGIFPVLSTTQLTRARIAVQLGRAFADQGILLPLLASGHGDAGWRVRESGRVDVVTVGTCVHKGGRRDARPNDRIGIAQGLSRSWPESVAHVAFPV